jgi:hypothetical protein
MSQAEIVVVLKSPGALDTHANSYRSLSPVTAKFIASLQLLFSLPPTLDAPPTELQSVLSEMRRYLVGHVPASEARMVINEVALKPNVDSAYIKPAAELPLAPYDGKQLAQFSQAEDLADFSQLQGYLREAPDCTGAIFARGLPGADGTDVRVIDIEGGWQLTHVDLRFNNGGLIGGTQFGNHGTAVLAEIGGDDNGFGVRGIYPGAMLSAISHGELGTARAMQLAAHRLNRGT